MTLPSSLDATHRTIYDRIFQPVANEPLDWREVRSLFREIGKAGWEANGDFKVVRNGHVLLLRPSPTREVSGADALLELQRFLTRSEELPPTLKKPQAALRNPPPPPTAAPPSRP